MVVLVVLVALVWVFLIADVLEAGLIAGVVRFVVAVSMTVALGIVRVGSRWGVLFCFFWW